MSIFKFSSYVITLLLFFTTSCSDQSAPDVSIGDFPEPITLRGEKVFKNNASLVSLELAGNYMLLSTRQDTIFHVYSRGEKHITSFGHKGKGPGEFQRAPQIEDIWKNRGILKMMVYDDIKKEPVIINLTSSIKKQKVVVDSILDLSFPSAMDISSIKNQQFIGMYDDRFYKKLDQKRGLFHYNSDTGDFETYNLKNIEVYPVQTMAAMNANNRTMAISPDRTKAVFSMMFYPLVEFFDIKNLNKSEILMSNKIPELPLELADFQDRKWAEFFIHAYALNQNVYLLESFKNRDVSRDFQKIKVIDWDANPVAQYIIPGEYSLNSIVVDRKQEILYGISYSNDAAYKFDLKP